MKKYNCSLFIFQRDFRLKDNLGLIECSKNSEIIIPVFIFTPEQITKKNKFKSNNAVQFMIESLEDLNLQLSKKDSRINYFYGKHREVLSKIFKNYNIDSVYCNRDYTPYAKEREKNIQKICLENDIEFNVIFDILLNEIESIKTSTETVYKKFSPYFRKAKEINIPKPDKTTISNLIESIEDDDVNLSQFYVKNENILHHGGRCNGLKRFKKINIYDDYNSQRNTLNYETTELSAYIKYGCVSIREVYHVFLKNLGSESDLIKQLYWRDFYYNIGFAYPRVLKGAMKEKYNSIKWENSKKLFKAWKNGRTGFPIVDACIFQINTTGYMHNRGRLITSSFLMKTLLIDWRWGEKYFAQTLYDYDVLVNNGNWQWTSGTGADTQPYFRIFNPWIQSKKHDPECEYIKKWLPELKNINNEHIHNWNKYYEQYDVDYPHPIVDYKERRKEALDMYSQVI